MKSKSIGINSALVIFWLLGLAVVPAHAECREPGKSAIQSRYRTIASLERMVESAKDNLRKTGMHPTFYESQHRIIDDRNKQIADFKKEVEELRDRYCQ